MKTQKPKKKNPVKKDGIVKVAAKIANAQANVTESWPIPNSQKDQLSLIKGIGFATETALNEIGVLKYIDFQNFTPETLSKTLEEKTGISISVVDIEKYDWIGHAQRLAKENSTGNFYEDVSDVGSESKNETPAQSDARDEEAETVTESDTGRTTSVKGKNNSNKAANSSKSSKKVDPNGIVKSAEVKDKPAKKSSAKSSAKVKGNGATKSKLDKPVNAAKNQDVKRNFNIETIRFLPVSTNEIDGTRILKSQVSFALAGKKAVKLLPEKSLFCVQVHALEDTSQQTQILASGTVQFEKDKSEYEIRLDCELPGIGNYQLKIVAFSLNQMPVVDFKEGPPLRILP